MNLQQTPSRLLEQPSDPKALDFGYAALNAETRIVVVQQRRSKIKTLMRRAACDIFDIRQKLLQVQVVQIRKNYVFGCSAAFALNSRLPVSLVTVAKVHIQLGVWQLLPKWMVALKYSQSEHLGVAEAFIFSPSENLDYG